MKTSDALILCHQAHNLFMALRGGAAMATFRKSCEQKKLILNFLSDSNMDFVEIQKKMKDVHDFVINNNIEAPAINKLFNYLWEIYDYAEYFAKLWYENVDDDSLFGYNEAICWSSCNAIMGYINEAAEMKGEERVNEQQPATGENGGKDENEDQPLMEQLIIDFNKVKWSELKLFKSDKGLPGAELLSFLRREKVLPNWLTRDNFIQCIRHCYWKDLYNASESKVKFRNFLVSLKNYYFNESYYEEIQKQLGKDAQSLTKHKNTKFITALDDYI